MNPGPRKILYLIQLPPPVHGVSTINSMVYNNEKINAGIEKLLLELRFSDNFSQLRRLDFSKIVRLLSLQRELRKILLHEKPDHVYFSVMLVGKGFWRDLLFVRIIKKSGSIPIYHVHNKGIAKQSRRLIFRILYRYVFKGSVVIHLSKELLSKEIQPLQSDNTRTFIVPNGIPDIGVPRHHKQKDSVTLFFLSNLFKEKGIFDLIRIMLSIREKRTDINLRICGDFMREKCRKKLMGRINKNGLGDMISIIDPIFDEMKEQEFSKADIFIFPSYFHQECFPLVLIEAMRHRLPIISSNIGAIPEMIEDGIEGLLINHRDIEGFTRAIIRLADDRELRDKIGSAARLKYLENFTEKHLENNIREVYSECFTEPG